VQPFAAWYTQSLGCGKRFAMLSVLAVGDQLIEPAASAAVCIRGARSHGVESMELFATERKAHQNLCVWNKTTAGMGSFYRSKHELVFIWKNGSAAHLNNFELGQHGRNRSNVWTYPGVNSTRTGRLEELTLHPTVKPVALVSDAIKDCSKRGALVLDPFCGSGTILIAAERTGRKARAIEIDPVYVDVAVRRWQKYTGKSAVLLTSGEEFEIVEEQRGLPAAAA
jgi:hypothetical protein